MNNMSELGEMLGGGLEVVDLGSSNDVSSSIDSNNLNLYLDFDLNEINL